MKKQKRKGVSKNAKTMFIQNCWLPVEVTRNQNIDHSIKSAFCFKDGIQWFFLVKSEKGFADTEPVRCECCKGELFRGDGFDSSFSASDTPEVFGCLLKHPSKPKTLVLAYIQSNMEAQKNALLAHLLEHDFSASFSRLLVIQAGSKFLRKTAGQIKLKENISTSSFLSFIKFVKPKKERRSYATRITELLKEKPTSHEKSDRLHRKKFSKLAKVALKKWQKNSISQNNSKLFKKFKKGKAKLSLLFPTKNIFNVPDDLSQKHQKGTKDAFDWGVGLLPSSSLNRLLKGLKPQMVKQIKKNIVKVRRTGSTSKKALVS